MTASASCTSCPRKSGTGIPAAALPPARSSSRGRPNSFAALTRAIVDATAYRVEGGKSQADRRGDRAGKLYQRRRSPCWSRSLTGTFADGLGGVKTDAERVDFDPFPWQSFAVWMLTQMKRWGQIRGDVDYKSGRRTGLSRHRYRQGDERNGSDAAGHLLQIVLGDGQVFDAAKPEDYLTSFKIRKSS